VKYAQRVKIWLFLMCVQFLNSCVRFLMDTILNLVIVQFLMKKKGDARYSGASPISIKGRCALWGRVSYLNKGRHTLWECISLLPNSIKKDCQQNILYGMLLAPACNSVRWHKYVTYLSQWAPCGFGPKSTAWSTSRLTSLKPLDHRMFISWWPWVLVGEVGLNF
jgi:hypothetical protein